MNYRKWSLGYLSATAVVEVSLRGVESDVFSLTTRICASSSAERGASVTAGATTGSRPSG